MARLKEASKIGKFTIHGGDYPNGTVALEIILSCRRLAANGSSIKSPPPNQRWHLH